MVVRKRQRRPFENMGVSMVDLPTYSTQRQIMAGMVVRQRDIKTDNGNHEASMAGFVRSFFGSLFVMGSSRLMEDVKCQQKPKCAQKPSTK